MEEPDGLCVDANGAHYNIISRFQVNKKWVVAYVMYKTFRGEEPDVQYLRGKHITNAKTGWC